MTLVFGLALLALLTILTMAAYVDRVYSESGKFLSREYQDNIDSWEKLVEPRLRLGRESIALSASVLRQLSVAGVAVLAGVRLFSHTSLLPFLVHTPALPDVARTLFELVLLILLCDRLIPQALFTRTQGVWITHIRFLLEALFYLILPVTMLLSLLLSIAALAEPEDSAQDEHTSEAMDALLEAGEEEGILEESDRHLVRSVVEFGDKMVRDVMTPRPQVFAVPATLTLQAFTDRIAEHAFSRVPVYASTLDHITGIAFAHDLLQVADSEAPHRTVAEIQRPAAVVPETKKLAELLPEMQREKQHMRIVIDEYGGVAGLVTIEDLLEAIVGSIADEHDEPTLDDQPLRQPDGAYIVSGTFEVARLRDLFREVLHPPNHRSPAAPLLAPSDAAGPRQASANPVQTPIATPSLNPTATRPHSSASPAQSSLSTPSDGLEAPALPPAPAPPDEDATFLRLTQRFESTSLGGLVTEIAGHIPLPGEVIEEAGLRLEVLASTDRKVDRVRVGLAPEPVKSTP